MQNGAISTWITSLNGFQPSSVVFACKTASFGQKSQVSIGPRFHLSFCVCKTAWLAPEILVSMGSSPHLLFLHAKQRVLDQNYMSLWVPVLTCLLCMQNSVICTRMTSLYGFQPSSLVLCLQNSVFRTRLTSLYGSQTSSVDLSTHNSVLSTRINRLFWLQPSPVVLCM